MLRDQGKMELMLWQAIAVVFSGALSALYDQVAQFLKTGALYLRPCTLKVP